MIISRRSFLKALSALGASVLGWRSSSAAQQKFYIPPTIHHVTEESAMLYFRLGEHTQNGLVKVLLEGESMQEIPFATADHLRIQILLENLAPATTYQYQVLVDGIEPPYLDETWSDLQFSTPPFEFPLRIAAIGDSGFGEQITYDLGEQMASHKPQLFFALGDIAYHMNQHNNDHFVNWQKKYFAPFQPLLQTMPHYPTIGNHEFDAPAILDGIPSYYWMFPPFNEDQYMDSRMWYSFDVNGIQFISLNSQLFYSHAYLRNEQEAWLDQKLARTDIKYTVVFFHIAPFTSSAPHQWDGIAVAQQWSPKFEAAKVPLVLAGHAHVYERLEQNGVNYITAGAGSNVIYGEGERIPQTKIMWRVTSYPILDLYEDRIHLTTYDMSGAVLDEADLAILPR